MLKKNKWKFVISCVLILLPVLFGLIMWNKLPDSMTTHWGPDGNADGFGGKVFAVFGIPAIMLVLHFVCLLTTYLDKRQARQNPKALGILFWIMPFASLFANGIVYGAAFGKSFEMILLVPILLGVMFLLIGNYMPKVIQNRTLGIKIFWTLNNEENWNKTHRFAGKVWVIGGLVLLASVLLPTRVMVWVIVCDIVAMILLPVVCSYLIYRRHRAEGIDYTPAPKGKAEKTATAVSAILVPILLIGVAVLMFTGDVKVTCEDTAFAIDATYWTNIEVAYAEVETLEYREDLDVGLRTSGFASARLSLGIFENGEFGSYTLYAYAGAEEYIVLTSGGKTLVIGLRETEATRALYDTLVTKIKE